MDARTNDLGNRKNRSFSLWESCCHMFAVCIRRSDDGDCAFSYAERTAVFRERITSIDPFSYLCLYDRSSGCFWRNEGRQGDPFCQTLLYAVVPLLCSFCRSWAGTNHQLDKQSM